MTKSIVPITRTYDAAGNISFGGLRQRQNTEAPLTRSKSGDELRELARAIEELLRNDPALSLAGAIVSNCCDHLRAIAQIHDTNADTARRMQYFECPT